MKLNSVHHRARGGSKKTSIRVQQTQGEDEDSAKRSGTEGKPTFGTGTEGDVRNRCSAISARVATYHVENS